MTTKTHAVNYKGHKIEVYEITEKVRLIGGIFDATNHTVTIDGDNVSFLVQAGEQSPAKWIENAKALIDKQTPSLPPKQ